MNLKMKEKNLITIIIPRHINRTNEIIDDLNKTKSKYLAKPNSNEFSNKFNSVFGKSFNEDETKNIYENSDNKAKNPHDQ